MTAELPPPSSPQERLLAAGPPGSLDALLTEIDDEDDDDIFGNRVEWKYVLPAAVAAEVRAAVAARLRLEEFVPGRLKTVMHSIYFDSQDFMLYRRAAARQSSLKFRLRTYTTFGHPELMDRQCFFECKIGKKGKKYKLRNMLPVLRAGDLLLPHRLGVVGTGRLIPVTEQRFMWKARRVLQEFKMSARLTVSYVREAFVAEDGSVRITFDEDYQAARIDTGDRTPLGKGAGGLDSCIVEVKFVNALPAWLADLLAAHDLPLGGMTFSKFRQGVALAYPDVAAAVAAERARALDAR